MATDDTENARMTLRWRPKALPSIMLITPSPREKGENRVIVHCYHSSSENGIKKHYHYKKNSITVYWAKGQLKNVIPTFGPSHTWQSSWPPWANPTQHGNEQRS